MGPLFEAISSGRDLRPLLAAGHSPNVYADFEGVSWTPLHLATYRCLTAVADHLLKAHANPNSPGLPAARPGAFGLLVGLAPLDLAISLGHEEMMTLLVACGGRPTRPHPPIPRLRQELAKARAVGAAESLVIEPLFLPLVEKAQQVGDWDEADRLLQCILTHEGEGEASLHRRIRGLLARGKVDEAMEEASLVFVAYRRQGDYLSALQVARSMRQIDPTSGRPYELELEFLCALGWWKEAEKCLGHLQEVHRQHGRGQELLATRARFEILRRRPENRDQSRPPLAWTIRPKDGAPPGNAGNLPALLDEEEERPPWWKLWWE